MKNQMSKTDAEKFEKMIVDLRIDPAPACYSTIADWKKA